MAENDTLNSVDPADRAFVVEKLGGLAAKLEDTLSLTREIYRQYGGYLAKEDFASLASKYPNAMVALCTRAILADVIDTSRVH